MESISFLERISKIFGLVTSSGFFISLLLIIILTIGFTIFNSKVKTKIPKIVGGIGYLLITVFIIFKYAIAFYNLQDSFTDKLFSSFYFPNLITYVSILLISIFVIVMDFISKNKTLVFKIIGVTSFGIILLLLALILDTVIKKEIDVYSAKSIYESNDLMILIQATTAVFFIWMVIELIDYYSRKIAKKLDATSNKSNNKNSNYNNLNSYQNYNISTETNANKAYSNISSNYNSYSNYKTSNNQNYGNINTNKSYSNSSNYNSNVYSENQKLNNSHEYKKVNYISNDSFENKNTNEGYKKVNYLEND